MTHIESGTDFGGWSAVPPGFTFHSGDVLTFVLGLGGGRAWALTFFGTAANLFICLLGGCLSDRTGILGLKGASPEGRPVWDIRLAQSQSRRTRMKVQPEPRLAPSTARLRRTDPPGRHSRTINLLSREKRGASPPGPSIWRLPSHLQVSPMCPV